MIVDSSALVTIFKREDGSDRLLTALAVAPVRRVSGGTWIELSAVATRGRVMPLEWLDEAFDTFVLQLEPVTIEQARIGHQAYRRYGQGSGSPARLNLGDCFAYALAKAMDEPLLFKGNDFIETDVKRAV